MATRRTTTSKKKTPAPVVQEQVEEIVEEIVAPEVAEELNSGLQDVKESAELRKRDILAIAACIVCSLLCSLITYVCMCNTYPDIKPKAIEVTTAPLNSFVNVATVHDASECVVYKDGKLTNSCEYYVKDNILRALFNADGLYTMVILSPSKTDVEVYCGVITVGTPAPQPTPQPTPQPEPQPMPLPTPDATMQQLIDSATQAIKNLAPDDGNMEQIAKNYIAVGSNYSKYSSVDEMFQALSELNNDVFECKPGEYNPKAESAWYSLLGYNGAIDTAINKYVDARLPDKKDKPTTEMMGEVLVTIGTIMETMKK